MDFTHLPQIKFCRDCASHKCLEEFPRNKNTKSGRADYCKPCHSERGKVSREKNGGARRYHLKKRYGIELEDFEALVEAQGGKCAICGEGAPTHLDHDHSGRASDAKGATANPDAVRGVLCTPCNNGLGLFKDDAARLEAAAAYLKKHRGVSGE